MAGRNDHGRKRKDSCSEKVCVFMLLAVSMTATVRAVRRRGRSK